MKLVYNWKEQKEWLTIEHLSKSPSSLLHSNVRASTLLTAYDTAIGYSHSLPFFSFFFFLSIFPSNRLFLNLESVEISDLYNKQKKMCNRLVLTNEHTWSKSIIQPFTPTTNPLTHIQQRICIKLNRDLVATTKESPLSKQLVIYIIQDKNKIRWYHYHHNS